MTKYYDNTRKGQLRIAVVDWDREPDNSRFGDEISTEELPADFRKWKCYLQFAHSDCSVSIMSPGGE